MSTKAIRELIAQARGVVDTDVTTLAEREVEAIEKAAREYFTWSVSPESRGVLTAIAKESGK